MQAKENKPANKPIVDTEPKKEPVPKPQIKEPASSTKPKSQPIVESKTTKTVTPPPKKCDKNLPQDSALRRHYLTNLRAMIESLSLPRPTDSSLSRHYDSLITAEIEHCVSDKGALERLICNYEGHQKTSAQQIPKPKTPAKPSLKAEISPKDRVVQHENAIAESTLSLRPTDSALRRHYDTMINTQANKTPKA